MDSKSNSNYTTNKTYLNNSSKMSYRDDFKTNSHLKNNEDDWKTSDFTSTKKYQTSSNQGAYKKSDYKRGSYSDNEYLDLSPDHRKSYDKSCSKDDDLTRQLSKKYGLDLYNSSSHKDKDNFIDNYKDTYKEPYKDSFKNSFKDPFEEPFKDSFKDSYKETYKDPFKDNYKDTFKHNDLIKAPDRKYNDLDKKFSSASEHSDRDYLNLAGEFDLNDEKKLLNKRSSNPYELQQTSKTGELRKLDYRRSSDLRKSIDLGKDKLDTLDNNLENIGSKITIDLSKDRYRSNLDEKPANDLDRLKNRFNSDDYFQVNSDTDGGTRENYKRKNSDFDKYSSDSLNNPVKSKFDKHKNLDRNFDKNLDRNLVDKQYDFGDGILDEIRRLELKEEVRKNEIMTELKNAENVLKHQNNHKFLHKADSLDNQIKAASNLSKTSSKF